MAGPTELPWTSEPEANRLLARRPLALMIGMLLDQQIPMEKAFIGPYLLRQRLGTDLDARRIAALDPDMLETVFKERPALHRFPASMARRTQELCAYLSEHYEGDPVRVWRGVRSGELLYERLVALPGFGSDKARIFVGVLGKRMGVRPSGWEAQAADWASIADVSAWEQIAELRERKRAAKRAHRT